MIHSDGQGAPQGGAGGAKHPRLGPRSGNVAVFKGSTGQFHEKIGASFYNPNRQNPAVSCLMFFSPVCMARGGDTTSSGFRAAFQRRT